MSTPAAIIERIIRTKATELGFETFVNHLQDKPDKAILLIDGKGSLDPKTLRGTQTQRDLVEIHVRASDHEEAAAVLPTLWEDIFEQTSATSSLGKIVQCITKANTMGCYGQEPQTRRWRFSQHFLVTII
jgi:hypothetical protein